MDIINLSTLFEQERQKKRKSQFSWIKYAETLQFALKQEINTEITKWIVEFIIITDLIDDLMDKDRPQIHRFLLKNKGELFNYLLFVLNRLKSLVSKQSYRQFISYITESLRFQKIESKYQLSIKSKEADYFELVKRSVFLMQSIVFLVDKKPPVPLLDAIKFIATSAQIDNDLTELEKDISFDILDNKGTLPLIKIVEWAKEEDETEVVDNLLDLTRENYTSQRLGRVLDQINNSPSLTYCHLLKLSFENEAKKKLEECGLEFIFDKLFNIKKGE